MSFQAIPGLAEPGMFSPGLLETSQFDIAEADTATATESNSTAATSNATDTASGTETNSAVATFSDTDTASASDSESIVVLVSDTDTGSGSEAESNSVPISVTDTASATDSESISVTLSDSDTVSGTEDASLAATAEDVDDSTSLDEENLAATMEDADSSASEGSEAVLEPDPTNPENGDNSGTVENESIAATTTVYVDTVSTVEDFSIVAIVSATDTGSSLETNGDIPVVVSDSDTSSTTETYDILPGAEDGDIVSSTESESIAVTLVSSDNSSVTETQVSPGAISASIGNYQATLVMGPATVYVADYGTAIPDTTAPLSGSWVDLGGTLGGVVLTVKQEFEEKSVTQKVDNPASRMKTRDLTVETVLAEPGLANLLYALNQGSINTGSGYKSYEPPMIDRATPLTYRTVVIDGWAPGIDPDTHQPKRRRIILRKALSTDGTTLNYSKNNQTGQDVVWSVHRVDNSTAPFKVIDEL